MKIAHYQPPAEVAEEVLSIKMSGTDHIVDTIVQFKRTKSGLSFGCLCVATAARRKRSG
jgi:hypothetical protein